MKTKTEFYYLPSYQTVVRLRYPSIQIKGETRYMDDYSDWVYVPDGKKVYSTYTEAAEIVADNFRKKILGRAL